MRACSRYDQVELTTQGETQSCLFDAAAAAAAMLAIPALGSLPGLPPLAIGLSMMAMPAALPDAPSSSRWPDIRIGAYAGGHQTMPSDVKLFEPGQTDLTLERTPWRGQPFKNPIYYGFRTIRWSGAEQRWGMMADFTHLKARAIDDAVVVTTGARDGNAIHAVEPVSATFDRLEFSHGYNILTLNAVRRLGARGAVSPYAGIGFGVAIPHVEVQRAGQPRATRTFEYQLGGPVAQFLAGAEWRIASRWSLFAEYKLSCSLITGRLKRDASVRTRLCSHQLASGVYGRVTPGSLPLVTPGR